MNLTKERKELLVQCLRREAEIAERPAPPYHDRDPHLVRWANRCNQEKRYGPQWSSVQWFGVAGNSAAARRCIRALWWAEAEDLITVTLASDHPGSPVGFIKLTARGKQLARSLDQETAPQEAQADG